MSSKINLQTCEYARKSSIFQDNQLILREIERYLRAERTSGVRLLIDGIKWKEEKISEEGQGIGEFDKLKKQLVQFIEESKEKSH